MRGPTRPSGQPQRRSRLQRELASARAVTDSLFGLIHPDALYDRPVAERHRLIFYLGHLEAFDRNLLASQYSGIKSFHPSFDRLFARGIDPEPGKAAADTPGDWPGRTEVESYNQKTREAIDSHLASLDSGVDVRIDAEVIEMAIEHRHMHAETLAYLLHSLEYSKKLPPASRRATSSAAKGVNPWVEVAGGAVELGTGGDGFAWDNERSAHVVEVPAFSIQRFKVSNGEYLEFVREGGEAPHFCTQKGGRWLYRGMFEEFPLPLDWPVWTTWDQAAAYAAYASSISSRASSTSSRRFGLPSEAQFQRATLQSCPPDAGRDNFDYRRWDPVPVDAGADDSGRPHQLTGNGWEWTGDVFAPFAGFTPHPSYAGYSADFFDAQHYVMKGASPRTALRLTRPGFRNWFRPDYPHMYAGFRLVQS